MTMPRVLGIKGIAIACLQAVRLRFNLFVIRSVQPIVCTMTTMIALMDFSRLHRARECITVTVMRATAQQCVDRKGNVDR